MDAEKNDQRPIVEQVKLRHKAVSMIVMRANIKRFTYDDYVTMFCKGDVQKVTYRFFSSKLHQGNYSN